MLTDLTGTPEFRCWNSLTPEEGYALSKAGRPLMDCPCRGCDYLRARGLRDVPRSDLTKTAA